MPSPSTEKVKSPESKSIAPAALPKRFSSSGNLAQGFMPLEAEISSKQVDALDGAAMKVDRLEGSRGSLFHPKKGNAVIAVAVAWDCPQTATIVEKIVKPLAERYKDRATIALIVDGTRAQANNFFKGLKVDNWDESIRPIALIDSGKQVLFKVPVKEALVSGTVIITSGSGEGWVYEQSNPRAVAQMSERMNKITGVNAKPLDTTNSVPRQLYTGCYIIGSQHGPHAHD